MIWLDGKQSGRCCISFALPLLYSYNKPYLIQIAAEVDHALNQSHISSYGSALNCLPSGVVHFRGTPARFEQNCIANLMLFYTLFHEAQRK